jgi:phosphopantothenoylcysteine decarboxylase/phosphopantothenate--cysteine ligase
VARILLGVTGGIAAYKALELTRLAMKAGHGVRVIQTEASTRFVGPASFAGITGAPVLIDEFERDPMRGAFPGQPQREHEPLSHLELVHNADVFLIAPCSANTLAKLATGLADNLLSTAALACRQPVVVAPAMNDAMWEHAATQDNVARLRARGTTVLEPGVGALGSIGEHGAGRLPEPPELLAAVEAVLAPRDLEGLEVLITAGGTREPIDAVRYVGNRSSGRMGFALADEALRRGARVTVVAANVSLPRNPAVDYLNVETAAELRDAAVRAFEQADVLLMAAAVADYRPAQAAAGKIKKDDQGEALALDLERTADVLSELSAHRRDGQTLVGFAAETSRPPGAVAYGRGKLERKGLDAVVVNDIAAEGIGFDTADNEVTLVTADGDTPVARGPKADVARAILDMVAALRTSSPRMETEWTR